MTQLNAIGQIATAVKEFHLDDIDAACADLNARGVDFGDAAASHREDAGP